MQIENSEMGDNPVGKFLVFLYKYKHHKDGNQINIEFWTNVLNPMLLYIYYASRSEKQ